MSIQPEGEDLRKAIKWISEQLQDDPHPPLRVLIEKACMTFDLSPIDEAFVYSFYRKGTKPNP